MKVATHKSIGGVLALLACLLTAGVLMGNGQGTPPPLPVVYSGWVQVKGTLAPDGLLIFARLDGYQSDTVAVKQGQYRGLKIAPLGAGYTGKTITFYATYGVDEVQARETAVYQPADPTKPASWTPKLDLYFDRLPMPPPTPTPTPTPTVTPTPTAALPIPGDSAVGAAPLWLLVAGALGLATGLAALALVRRRSAQAG